MHVCLEEEYSSAAYIYYYGVYKVGTSTRVRHFDICHLLVCRNATLIKISCTWVGLSVLCQKKKEAQQRISAHSVRERPCKYRMLGEALSLPRLSLRGNRWICDLSTTKSRRRVNFSEFLASRKSRARTRVSRRLNLQCIKRQNIIIRKILFSLGFGSAASICDSVAGPQRL